MRALVLGVATLALSAGAALAQAPNQEVYPGSGYAPFGYGYAPSPQMYNYAAPPYSYSGPAYGPATERSIPAHTARHHRSVHMSASGSHKGDSLKAAPASGGY